MSSARTNRLGPDARAKPVAAVIGEHHCLIRRAEGHGGENRAENLFPHHGRGGTDTGDQRRRVEAARLSARSWAADKSRRLLPALGYKLLDALKLNRRDDRSDVDRLVERRTDAQGRHPTLEARDERLGNPFLQQEAGACTADLALIEPDGIDKPFDRAIDIRVVEDDVRPLAAQFERQRLAGSGRLFADQPADIGRAGKGDLVDTRMLDEGCTVSPSPVTMFSTPAGKPAFAARSANKSAVSGVNSAGFSTTVLPSASAGAIFQASISNGKFRHDLSDDTDRIEAGKLDLLQFRPAGMMIEMPGGERNIDIARLADRFAIVERLDHGEETRMLLHHAGKRIKMPGATFPAEPAPLLLRRTRGLHRRIDIGTKPLGDAGQRLAGGRIMRLETMPLASHPSAVDEMPKSAAMARDPGRASSSASGAGP